MSQVIHIPQRPNISPQQQAIDAATKRMELALETGITYNGNQYSAGMRELLFSAGITSGIAVGKGVPNKGASIEIRSKDRQKVQLTSGDYLDLSEARRDYAYNVEIRFQELIDEILASDNPLVVDIDSGWPG